MIKPESNFARIGRSFPSEAYEPLYQASLAARAGRRGQAKTWDGQAKTWDGSRAKVWRGSDEVITVPLRLTA